SGPFCGTISSKKKKKMMYLTTRNAVAKDDRSKKQLYESEISGGLIKGVGSFKSTFLTSELPLC
ncbi:MPP6 isoform 3, partial [Pongo abelii]